MSKLSRFKIEGLYNSRTIDLQIEDNTLILVGENGTGKSTVVNLLYFFLTSQWNRMVETPFKGILAEIDDNEYSLDRNDIGSLKETIHSADFSSRLPNFIVNELSLLSLEFDGQEFKEKSAEAARKYGIPPSMVYREISHLTRLPKKLAAKVGRLELAKKNIAKQVLYLPTYRRIEQELEKIFPDIDTDQISKNNARRKFRGVNSVSTRTVAQRNYIELVEFGMEDVAQTIRKKTIEIERKVRAELSNLTGEYLRDVIRGSYQSANLSQLKDVDEETFNNILSRIPEEILQDNDKAKLGRIVSEFNETGELDERNQVVAHFLTSLIQLYQKQQDDEKDIQNFISVCNEGYLTGKQFRYNSENFDVDIVQKSYGKNKSLQISSLSSGEKQIVSLFSYLYLSDTPNPFVVIDEPELSLSVPWQRRFLPDISNQSNGLVAVTHSPFIYDNKLRKYTHSLDRAISF